MKQSSKAKKTRISSFYQTWFFGDMLNVLYFPNSETRPTVPPGAAMRLEIQQIRLDSSPKCGMALEPVRSDLEAEEGDSGYREYRRRLL